MDDLLNYLPTGPLILLTLCLVRLILVSTHACSAVHRFDLEWNIDSPIICVAIILKHRLVRNTIHVFLRQIVPIVVVIINEVVVR